MDGVLADSRAVRAARLRPALRDVLAYEVVRYLGQRHVGTPDAREVAELLLVVPNGLLGDQSSPALRRPPVLEDVRNHVGNSRTTRGCVTRVCRFSLETSSD